MDKKEFEKKFSEVKANIADSYSEYKQIIYCIKIVTSNVKTFIELHNNTDKNIEKYIELLGEFDYADSISSPVDLFPGIKTAKEMADPDELKKKADELKTYAFNVKSNHDKSEMIANSVSESMQHLFKIIKDYNEKESQTYKLSMNLIKELDSIYDVSGLIK